MLQKGCQRRFRMVWIDTCCIDKSSSAELSEAINSMYQWYQQSSVCYAYLEDVTTKTTDTRLYDVANFTASRWFTRGWTLQELIAPKIVQFFTAEWSEIGTKTSLSQRLHRVSRIPLVVLRGKQPSKCSVAERMGWAAARNTTRVEDMAYSLMGLFNVNMPLLYGEGSRAFIRLQEQILRQEEDYSIFAWTVEQDCDPFYTGVLATDPSYFSQSHSDVAVNMPALASAEYMSSPGPVKGEDVWMSTVDSTDRHRMLLGSGALDYDVEIMHEPSQITTRGLRLHLPVLLPRDPRRPTLLALYSTENCDLVCILLGQTLRLSTNAQRWARCAPQCLILVKQAASTEFVVREMVCHENGLIRKSFDSMRDLRAFAMSSGNSGRLQLSVTHGDHVILPNIKWPADRWEDDHFKFQGEPPFIGGIAFDCAIDKPLPGTLYPRFLVISGVGMGHWWCRILLFGYGEKEDTRMAEVQEKLTKTIRDIGKPSVLDVDVTVSDRAAVWCFPGKTIFHASIRKLSNKSDISYCLQVGISEEDGFEPWMLIAADQGY